MAQTVCQLCGVSFAIARIRRDGEPESAAWDGDTVPGFYVPYESHPPPDDTCASTSSSFSSFAPSSTRCYSVDRRHDGHLEHIAGPACRNRRGYSGCRIGVEEMRGCCEVRCLRRKRRGWVEEDGDEVWEREGAYFLTGVGEGDPAGDDEGIVDVRPVRHGCEGFWATNAWTMEDVENDEEDDEDEDEDDLIMDDFPFHPWCFEIFKKVSTEQLGGVDSHGLWYWRVFEGTYEKFFEEFPRDYAVRLGCEEEWNHEPGTEYLAANPIDIPGLDYLLRRFHRPGETWSPSRNVFRAPDNAASAADADATAGSADDDETMGEAPPSPATAATTTPLHHPATSTANDPFLALPAELAQAVLAHLPAASIASLRRASRAYAALPTTLFRHLVLREMPWLWEARALEAGRTDWFGLWCMVRRVWAWEVKGLRNRRRIWRDVGEVVRRVAGWRAEGRVRWRPEEYGRGWVSA